MLINRLVVIGVGLIGGSVARDARKFGLVKEIIGCGRGEANLQKAVELGVVDSYTTDVADAVKDADMVLMAAPMGAFESLFRAMKPALSPNTIITDAGSVKGCVVDDAIKVFGEVPANLVPAHPIAGTEKSGVEASFEGLYRDRRVLLTPTEQTDPQATAKVRALWTGIGARVDEIGVEHHDKVLAATSHLPHLLAYGLVDTLARMDDSREIFSYAAGGFRDFTRIAASDPQMWHDINFTNRKAILEVLDLYRADLDQLRHWISTDDSESLMTCFKNAKSARDHFSSIFHAGKPGDGDE
ncbi:prephenate dehydrogenase [Pelagibaculum spongiae]|uniref:prephenate dehydrogenase n=1 Tax=Pelagibaculum spongiae TaxID=2080658 RepID=A0A2V1GX01_9GAMM|nr:prephenate dehydrogenase/arogenate dehydrogenase family protein [Pelagibaculum spongiae]